MLRTERYNYVFARRGVSLYDLQQDPAEERNLAGDPAHAETVRRLHQRLRDMLAAGWVSEGYGPGGVAMCAVDAGTRR